MENMQNVNPYVGPLPFDNESKDIFFGRDEEAQRLLSMVFANKIVILSSQSGAGKTSLLNTKMEELLKKEDFNIFKINNLNINLEKNKDVENFFVYNTVNGIIDERKSNSKNKFDNLVRFLKINYPELSEHRFVLIFDPFETIFTSHIERWKDRESFLNQIQGVCDNYKFSRIIFAIRDDFLGRLNRYSKIWKKAPFNFHLEPLKKEQALLAIKGPLTHKRYEDGIADFIVNELIKIKVEDSNHEFTDSYSTVEGEYVEPIQLQIVCKALWDSLYPENEIITHDHLTAIGGVDKVLEDFYEQSLRKALGIYPDIEIKVRDWIESKLITSSQTRNSFLVKKITNEIIPQPIIDSLIDSYLIRIEVRMGARWITLSNDRLIDPIRKANRKWIENELRNEQEVNKKRIQKIKRQYIVYTSIIAILVPIIIALYLIFIK